MDRNLREFISLHTEKPIDVIHNTVSFMSNIIKRSKYVIFQSNFGFCDNDTPFTCIVEKSGENFNIEFWDVDWSSFTIENPPASDRISNEWELTRKDKIPNWKELSAKEIINHNNFTDKQFYGEHFIVASNTLDFVLFQILERYYDPDEPFGINSRTSGLIAVIYREPLEELETADTTCYYENDEDRMERCKGCKYMILSSFAEDEEYNISYCKIKGYNCNMIIGDCKSKETNE